MRRRGFTLVELLVVIGVIAVLVSILVPILAGSRDAAVRLRCMSNMRQLLNASMMYQKDYNGHLPYPNWGTNSTGWLYRSPLTMRQDYVRTGMLWRYHQSEQLYRCPLDTGPWVPIYPSSNLTSYLMNGAASGYGSATSTTGVPIPPRGCGMPARWFKSDAICFWEPTEERLGGAQWNDGSSYPREGITIRHGAGAGDGACVGTFGGSAEWMTRAEFARLSAQNIKNRLWCSPLTSNGH